MSNKKNIPIAAAPEEIVYKGKLIEIVHQRMKVGTKEFTMEIARRSPGVRLIIVSQNKKILLTKEYRMEIKKWDIRLPGGKVFDTLHEYNDFLQSEKDIIIQAKKAAIKEAREEVGLEINELSYLTTSSCGASITWDLFFFVATKFKTNLEGQHLELGENIELTWVSLQEAKELCLNGAIKEGRSIAVLLQYLSTKI